MGAAAMKFLVAFLIPCGMFAQISLDNHANLGASSGTTLTVSFTTAGTNRSLAVACTNGGTSTTYITGVTYAGTTVPLVAVEANSANSGNPSYLFYLTNPALGANNIIISTGGGTGFRCDAHSYDGVKQTGQPEASTGTQMTCGNSTLCVQTLTTLTANAWLVTSWSNIVAATWTCTSGNGETCTNMDSVASSGTGIADRGPMSSAGSNTISATITGQGAGNNTAGVVLSMAPAAAAASSLHLLNLLGVGQ